MSSDRFSIVQPPDPRDSFGAYWYEVYRNDHLVAHVWHDYRGSESGIRFVDKRKSTWPFINVVEFLTGGGSQPLALTEAAEQYFFDEFLE